MQYSFIHVTNEEILDKVHRFRYKVMHEEFGWIRNANDKKERDIYDDYCEQFAILNANQEICASMRLIHHSPIGYPTEDFLDLSQTQFQYDREKLSEMSRIFIDSKYRNMRDTKIFISSIVKSLAYEKIKEYGIEYCYGMMEPKFIKLVNMFKIPYKPIADLHLSYGRFRQPSMMYVKELEEQNPQLAKYWDIHKEISVLHLDTNIKPDQIII
ncbi:acyl-homoserine-lactone synthase [Sulfurimonas sp.]|uniref:acyl-homoserine-lactone synthase n=1 Tax=Sulfurimonas sp. TaxID=2022749 RepID=UPI003D140950